MAAMTGIERMGGILKRQKTDRIGLFEHFWGDTHKLWSEQGHIGKNEGFGDHFGFDMDMAWPFNLQADIYKEHEIVKEDADTIYVRDGNGALLRRHKKHDTTPEHIDFLVKDSENWNNIIRPMLKPNEDRINFEAYRWGKEHAKKRDLFFAWCGVNVFESIHPLCGHENMLVGMALEPEWVKDMAEVYADMSIGMMEILFEKEGKPDGIWFYEDMGFKERPFMSPAMYREIIYPSHKKTIDFAHSLGLPVIMHSCGYIEPLLPDMIKAGIDCLQVIEVKAGMDLLKLYKLYGDKISFMGGIDVRVLYTNDKNLIDNELNAKIPVVKQGFGYTLHSDHSIPESVSYETYRYFVERGLELGKF